MVRGQSLCRRYSRLALPCLRCILLPCILLRRVLSRRLWPCRRLSQPFAGTGALTMTPGLLWEEDPNDAPAACGMS
jgi:hypothetical protein